MRSHRPEEIAEGATREEVLQRVEQKHKDVINSHENLVLVIMGSEGHNYVREVESRMDQMHHK